MSAKNNGEQLSDESNNNTNDSAGGYVTCDNADRIMRLAAQRQSTEDYEARLADETDVDGSVDGLFDDDGQLRDAESVAKQTSDSPQSLEAWLKQTNPGRHAKWEKAVEQNMFPNKTADELLNHVVQNEVEDAEADGRNISPDVVDDAPSLVINTQQRPTEDKWEGVDSDDETHDGQACPECDSTNTSSYQQQTGGADEGMTSFHKCADCGKSWRGGYAS